MAWVFSARAAERLSKEEALATAFPGCEVVKTIHYLTTARLGCATELAGLKSAPWTPHRGERDGASRGSASFDSHLVRTLAETLMVVVDANGLCTGWKCCPSTSPRTFPKPAWYAQLEGKVLDSELALKRSIHPVTGASLTARATTEALRRVLAVHRVLTENATP